MEIPGSVPSTAGVHPYTAGVHTYTAGVRPYTAGVRPFPNSICVAEGTEEFCIAVCVRVPL